MSLAVISPESHITNIHCNCPFPFNNASANFHQTEVLLVDVVNLASVEEVLYPAERPFTSSVTSTFSLGIFAYLCFKTAS